MCSAFGSSISSNRIISNSVRFAGWFIKCPIEKDGNKLINNEQMKLEIFEYIEIWYNKKRRHSVLNYQNIDECNNQFNYKNVA